MSWGGKLKPCTETTKLGSGRKSLMAPKLIYLVFCPKCYSSFATWLWLVLHVMSDGVVFTSNRLDRSTIWMLFLPITELSKIGSFLTSFTRHGCLRFQSKKDRLRPHAAGCQKISNLRVMHFSVTNLMWLTYRLMHDSDLFTLQSIQCIPFWSLTRMRTRVTKDHWSIFLWEKCTHVGC